MLPVETIEALFPSTDVVGKITLHPLTLGRAALLDMMGLDCTARVSADDILLAAWVLSMEDAEVVSVAGAKDRVPLFQKWCERKNPDLYELGGSVVQFIVAAFSAYVQPANDDGQTVYATQTGYGWPLELAECLMHEYGMKFDEALATPIARAYGLVNCARQRNGGKQGGFDYYERIAAKKASEQFRRMREEAAARAKAEAEKKDDKTDCRDDGGKGAEVKDNG